VIGAPARLEVGAMAVSGQPMRVLVGLDPRLPRPPCESDEETEQRGRLPQALHVG